jgi:hypothetical protein
MDLVYLFISRNEMLLGKKICYRFSKDLTERYQIINAGFSLALFPVGNGPARRTEI